VSLAQIASYQAALKDARTSFERATKRLAEISSESYHLNDEITRLRRTITALSALCSQEPMLDSLGITDTCMEVMETEKGTVTTSDVVRELEARGFDLTMHKNAPASVHAILTRLARKGKIEKIDDSTRNVVSWRGPNYDPKCDEDIPF
jgi:chromosome segregation ATPase